MKQNGSQSKKAAACISSYFLDAWGIDAGMMLETETISPKRLLSANRFDLACKLYYIDCLEKGTDTAFAKELYQAHIEAFSDGAFIEPGLNSKNSIQDYFEVFDRLIAEIRTNGFDLSKSVVPVGGDDVILDGSHRVAIAIYYNIPLTVVRVPGRSCNYDYAYFRERGLREAYLDFMAYQFIRFADQVYTACLWPAAYDEKKLAIADRMIRNSARVVYQKEAFLNYHGVEQLMITFYKSMAWTGSIENAYSGVASKAMDCFRRNAPTTVYVITGASLEQVLELKQRIRDLYAIENSSVHITDTHAEAIETGEMLLHQNSIDFMNYGEPYGEPAFVKTVIREAETGQLCASPETTMALYGVRDYRQSKDEEKAPDLQHPKDYFYFRGMRVPSLEYVKEAKKRSGTLSDSEDVRMIEAFERKKSSARAALKARAVQTVRSVSAHVSLFWGKTWSEFRRTMKVLFHRIKYRGQNKGTGKRDIQDLQTVFLRVNTTTADYLVMRNWEGFFDDILLEGHNDIDLLCRDKDSRDIIVRLLDAKPLTSDGFHYCFQYRGRKVTLDTRILGDGYYDRRWQRSMLRQKRLHPLGFYVMDSENYFYSLIYHAIYQKETGLSDEYAQRLNQMTPVGEVCSQNEFAARLSAFMNQHRYVYTETADKSVVKNFGITPDEKKIRYPWNVRLYHFAQRVKSKNLLQKLKYRIRKTMFRG